MAADALIDTGAILSILDTSDTWHDICSSTLLQLRFPMLTSEAVLTELFHLTSVSRARMEAAWAFVNSGAIVLGKIENSELKQMHDLMSRYWDRPMDFADATLVHLANRESIDAIFTTDHDDFATYRLVGKRRFRILPVERP
jgi:predicted nucleic acid-binding protein